MKLNQKGAVDFMFVAVLAVLVAAATFTMWRIQAADETINETDANTSNQSIVISNSNDQESEMESSKSDDASVDEVVLTDVTFNRDSIESGDRVGALSYDRNELSRYYFNGEVTVTGAYSVNLDDPLLGDTWCMRNLDEESLAKIPKETSDSRDVWFCFTNTDEVQSVLGNDSIASITVTISEYVVDLKESSVFNTATFVSAQ